MLLYSQSKLFFQVTAATLRLNSNKLFIKGAIWLAFRSTLDSFGKIHSVSENRYEGSTLRAVYSIAENST